MFRVKILAHSPRPITLIIIPRFTLMLVFFCQAFRIVERAVPPTALVIAVLFVPSERIVFFCNKTLFIK